MAFSAEERTFIIAAPFRKAFTFSELVAGCVCTTHNAVSRAGAVAAVTGGRALSDVVFTMWAIPVKMAHAVIRKATIGTINVITSAVDTIVLIWPVTLGTSPVAHTGVILTIGSVVIW